ncbi:MAG TPA: hypothetical protein VFA27_16645 [Vicinamibacterales bacterium]|nr:hypothetical protein [Vicinamibacterales bacterium]
MTTALLALTLATVLAHAGQYVARFERELSGFVAEERYLQDWPVPPRGQRIDDAERHRELVSDVILAKVGADWMQFRDVREMNGAPVTYRGESMLDLIRRHEVTRPMDVDALVDRSASYNIGNVARTVNTPLFALKFLEAANQARCRFTVAPDRTPATVSAQPDVPGAFRTSTEIWVVEYEERQTPTLIRDRRVGGKNVPSRGRFWIEPDSGRILMSEIVARSGDLRGTIDVSYQSEPVHGLMLPIEMHEWYESRKSGSKIETVATYGAFRSIQE